MNKKKVDILLITYNHEKYIEKCMEGILNQKIGNFKMNLIVGEDKSPDKTREILKKYQLDVGIDIKFIFRENNVGAISNFLEALKECKGDYIVFLEGDDFFIDETLVKRSIEFLEENLNYSGVCHSEKVIDLNEKILYINKSDKEIKSPIDFIQNNDIPTLGLTFRNYIKAEPEKFEKLFKENIFIADYQLKSYLLTKGFIKFFSDVATAHRLIYNTTSFASQSKILKAQDFKIALKNTKEYYNNYYNNDYNNIFEELITRVSCGIIKEQFKVKAYGEILKCKEKRLILKNLLKIFYKKWRTHNEK